MKRGPSRARATLANQVALVTGAARGIGRAVSLALAREGARLVLAARTAAQIEAVRSEIAAGGGEALAVRANVSREDDVLLLFREAEARFGRLDVLVKDVARVVLFLVTLPGRAAIDEVYIRRSASRPG